MENLVIPSFKNMESEDAKKLLTYVEDVRHITESRLTQIENQLEIIKEMLKGGE